MKYIRQKRRTVTEKTEHLYMMYDIRDTDFIIKEKLQDAYSFYDLLKCTIDDFLSGSKITEHDELIVSPKITQLYSNIQNAIKYCTPKARSLFNACLMDYTDALAQGESLDDLRSKIIPIFKQCFKESIDILCKKIAFSGN
ncbi:MAG: hypothetical protein ACFFD2_10110 [Promethearchaeota archaeon]